MNSFMKQASLWIVIAIVVIMVMTVLPSMQTAKDKLTQDDFLAQLKDGNVESVSFTTEEGSPTVVNAKLKNAVNEQKIVDSCVLLIRFR